MPTLKVGTLFMLILGLGVLAADPTQASGQASYTAQVRGVVTDQTGAVMPRATVTITNDATNISLTTHSDDHGQYFLTGLRPAVYTIKAEVAGFQPLEKKNIVLQVDQETSINFELRPLGVLTTVEVTTSAPLLDTESPTLGTEITNEYVKDIPLFNRSFFGLTFLSGGVTEAAGSGATDNYPTGTNFVSNGQRNATAEVRIDGALVSAPEQGEGATSNIYYEPSVEIVQEFKVQNNSFSAEFGNNGGTVVNMALKSGGNKFHGSGSYFLQRGGTDARDFFDPKPGVKPSRKWDSGGFSIGGPIKRDKTFFFFDFLKTRDDEPININVLVPTQAERIGDFSALGVNIYDPRRVACSPNPTPPPTLNCNRPQVGFDINGNPLAGQKANVIPKNEIDPIGQALINLYPLPNFSAPVFQPNFRENLLSNGPSYQFDIKIDHQLNEKQRISGRYSALHSNFITPAIFGDGSTGTGIGGTPTRVQNVGLEYTWTINPHVIWTNRFAVDRAWQPVTPAMPTIESFNASLPSGVQGFPKVLEANNGVNRMPTIAFSGNNPGQNLFDQCCVNTNFAHTLYSYSSQLVISRGKHLFKLGGEQRLFYNNFWQPPNPTGLFNFTDYVTSPTPFSNSDASGNNTGDPFASMLFGYADNVNGSSGISVFPPVANKSKETGFYFQDDWKVNSKLTLNLGLRYEWSTPYTERFNHIQFSDFNADSGMSINLSTPAPGSPYPSAQQALQTIGLNAPNTVELTGTTQFASSSVRTVPVDRNNIGPRVGFAYQFLKDTVIRGGAGVYYGMNIATNYQYPGTAFRNSPTFFFTTDGFATQSATLANPLVFGLTPPEGQRYGKLAEWGFSNFNDLGTTVAQNADIYQWNLGIQRLLPSQIVVAVDYSANRSTHLPWGGDASTRNRNFIDSGLLAQISAAAHTSFDKANGAGACDNQSCVSSLLQGLVVNPFCTMFGGVGGPGCLTGGANQIFNEPDSRYGLPTIPLGNLLRPHPQFDGNFEGLPLLEGSSWYQSMQIRFQKRTTHHISFEGSYTVSKNTDTSSAGRNAFVGTYDNGNPQQLDRLYREHSISANDAPQRLAAAVVVELPVGRNNWIGNNMNRALDAVIGGWSLSTLVTEQSGQPMAILMSTPRLMDGNQRPDIVCSQLKSGISMHAVGVSGNGNALSFFNPNCFADPGDENPGNAPRYFSGLRTDGIHNVDLNFFKEFVPKEGTRLELRAEVYNFANHPRFGVPNLNFGSSQFGTITGSAAGANPRRFQFGVRFEF